MGKLAKSTVSRDMTHLPKAVIDFYDLKDGDILEWWSTDTEIPEEQGNLVGVRIRRMSVPEKAKPKGSPAN